MHQALHIFKKDFRCFRYEISLLLAVIVAFVLLQVQRRHALPYGASASGSAEMLMVLIAVVLIGRLVLAEAIPGQEQFWITRPYRWKSLLGAKLLFIAVCVTLPILLAQLCIVMLDGFPLGASLPGLLWSGVLLFVFVALPVAAIAAVSRNLATFLFAALILFAISSFTQSRRLGVEWVLDSLALLLLLAIAAMVLYFQYRRRRTTLSRWFGLAGAVLGGFAILSLPWQFALALQSRLSQQPSLGDTIQVAFGQRPTPSDLPNHQEPEGALYIPVTVLGSPGGTEVHIDALSISLRDAAGHVDCGEVTQHSEPAGLVLRAVCRADSDFVKRNRGKLVTIRGSVYLTLFGNAKSTVIPITDEPTNASAGLQCYTDQVSAEWDVFCRSAFRWPSRLLYAKLGSTSANSFKESVSYSPFPADLGLNPIETRWASAYAYGPPPTVRDVTIVAEEPMAHLRRDFEAPGVRLSDFVVPPARYGTPPLPSANQ
jgi:hypothetical protein